VDLHNNPSTFFKSLGLYNLCELSSGSTFKGGLRGFIGGTGGVEIGGQGV